MTPTELADVDVGEAETAPAGDEIACRRALRRVEVPA